MLLIGGPPLHGKALLAAHLAELLPFARKLEVADNLIGNDEHWWPEGVEGPARRRPLRSMLTAAVDIWQRSEPRPIVILSARAGSPAARRLARRVAVSAGIPFLAVEARSHPIRAVQRLTGVGLPKARLLAAMRRYDRAVADYRGLDRDEVASLPGLRLSRVLDDIEAAGRAVLARWSGR